MGCRLTKTCRCDSQLFLVSAFSLKEKSPTITVGSFFSFSADNLTLNGPLLTIFMIMNFSKQIYK